MGGSSVPSLREMRCEESTVVCVPFDGDPTTRVRVRLCGCPDRIVVRRGFPTGCAPRRFCTCSSMKADGNGGPKRVPLDELPERLYRARGLLAVL